MNLAKERFTENTWLPPWTIEEHFARYRFASRYVRNMKVVDCACGAGQGIKFFLNKKPKKIFGFDIDAKSIDMAKKIVQDTRVQFKATLAGKLPLPDKSCDVFISLETIEHLNDENEYLCEAYRVLKCSGSFIISTPNRAITNPGTLIHDRPWNKFHIREYTPEELKNRLSPYFLIKKMFGQNPVSSFGFSLRKTLGRHLGGFIAARVNQLFKLPWFFFAQKGRHEVRSKKTGTNYEYIIFVCRPKKHFAKK